MTFARKIGDQHIKNNKLCEDYVNGKFNNDTAVIALSDGGGSKKYALETATILVENIITFGLERDIFNATSKDIVDIMNTALKSATLPMEDMGATLLFVVIKDGKYLAGHIGDGVILLKDNGEFRLLSEPENGEYLNQTYFLPISIENSHHLRLYTGDVKPDTGFILSSDGIASLLYDSNSNIGMNVCNKLDQWNRIYSFEESRQIIKENIDNVLSQYTWDDISIGVLSVMINEPDQLS